VTRILGIAILIILVPVLGAMQIASDAIDARAGVPGSIPARLSPALGARIDMVLARAMPLPSIEAMLARYDLDSGDLAAATAATAQLPGSSVRDELFGQIARSRGDHRLAMEYFLVAPDVAAVQAEIDRWARVDRASAYRLETRLLDRLIALTTHPDAVAQAYWHLGKLETSPLHALQDDQRAVALAPFSDTYMLAAASKELTLGRPARAARYYQRILDADPTNRDAIKGLAKLRNHQR
jgi:tetratricopeptide (TPR) repeat protein